MSPKKGHIAMQVSGGLLGTNLVRAKDGSVLLLKGGVSKLANTRIIEEGEDPLEEEDANDDRRSMDKVEVQESFQTRLALLTQTEYRLLTDPQEIAPVLEEYVGQLAEIVQNRNVPVYDMQAEPWEWAVFDPLSRTRRLPGRTETGLTDFQKHLAVALGRLCLNPRRGAGFCNAEMGSGKAQPLHAKLLTPTGWKTMNDIRIGDDVIGSNGKPTKVIGVFPQGEKEIFRVIFTDDSWAECCDEHLWTVSTPLNKWKGNGASTLSLRMIMTKGLSHANGNLQHFIPLVHPIAFSAKEQPLDPYLVGALLGDGCFGKGSVLISSVDREILDRVTLALPKGVILKKKGVSSSRNDYALTTGVRSGGKLINSVMKSLRDMGLMGLNSREKFIPSIYLFGSIEQRTALLQGLLDTDGYVRPESCTIEFSTISPKLADDVTFIVQSLGGTVTRRIKEAPRFTYRGEKRIGQRAYRLFIALRNEIRPFHLSRKMADYLPRTKYQPSRAICSVEIIGKFPAQCIKVDAEDGLYVTDNCVVTHNTTVALALAEYLHTAKNRKQNSSDAYPALVVGPGVVTGSENWPKEIREVTPGAASVVITSGARPLPKPEKIGRYLASLGLSLNESECEGKSADAVLRLIRQQAKKQKIALAEDLLAALLQSLRAAVKFPPVRRRGAAHPNLLDGRIGGILWTGMDLPRDPNSLEDLRGKFTIAQFVREYQSGKLPAKSFAILSYETAKLGSGRVPAMPFRTMTLAEYDADGNRSWRKMRVCVCPRCGRPVALERKDDLVLAYVTPANMEEFVGLRRRFCDAPSPRRIWNAEKGKHETRDKDDEGNYFLCGSPLYEVSALRRISAAEYIRKKVKRFFGLCLVDECFPGNTPVWTPDKGWVQIQNIRPGDVVYSIKDGKLATQMVSRLVIKKRAGSLVTISHSHGTLTCTPNHPIYTTSGVKQANDLQKGDILYGSPNMPNLQQSVLSQLSGGSQEVLFHSLSTPIDDQASGTKMPYLRDNIHHKAIRQNVLLQKVQLQGQCSKDTKSGLSEGCSPLLGEDEKAQSYEQPEDSGVGGCEKEGESVYQSGWEWATHKTADDSSCGSRFTVASGISNNDGCEILALRPSRLGTSGSTACHRGRWSYAPTTSADNHRPEEDCNLRELRVEGVEVYQSGGNPESSMGYSNDSIVYNLEVEEFS